MAITNYTTKTAALRATRADMRQVAVSKKIEIGKSGSSTIVSDKEIDTDVLKVLDTREGSETQGQRTDIMSILGTMKNGIDVHADADGDYVADSSGVTTAKINFLGAFVNVVDDGENGVNVYIGENNNNPSYSYITDTLNDQKYVYASSTNAYSLPSDATAGSLYPRTSYIATAENVSLNGGAAIGNILADQVITVTVTSSTGTITYSTDRISAHAGTVAAPTSYTWEDTENGIKVVGTSLIKYTANDAKDGFTPNSSSGKFVVTITNSKMVAMEGGWYNVSVQLGGTTKATSKVFVYISGSVPSVGKPVITYSAGGTRQVSGLTYDASGSFTLTVSDIAGTQYMVTDNLNRLALTDNAGDVNFAGTIATNTAGMSLASGTATDETAVYSYTTTKSVTKNAPAKVSAKISAQAYGMDTGSFGVQGTKVASDTTTSSTWLYTATTPDTDLVTNFYVDGNRVKNTLADIKAGSDTTTYDSATSLIGSGNYTDQLLVQGGQLKYPNSDSTARYTGATETRYYVRPVKFGGSGQINTINVTVGGLTAFNNDEMRIYLVKKGVADAQVLNWFKTASCSYGAPVADVTAPSSNKWTCTINNDVYQVVGGVADTYYLVVEMTSSATAIGAITLA